MLYALASARDEVTEAAILKLFSDDMYLQLGGNETVGHGWFAVALRPGGAA